MFGLKGDWSLEVKDRYFTLEDYSGAEPRWCTGCGDHGILAAVHRVCRDSRSSPRKRWPYLASVAPAACRIT